MPLGSNLATPRGSIVSIDLQLEKLKKSSLKPLGPQLRYFVQYSQRDVYITHAYERGISHVT